MSMNGCNLACSNDEAFHVPNVSFKDFGLPLQQKPLHMLDKSLILMIFKSKFFLAVVNDRNRCFPHSTANICIGRIGKQEVLNGSTK